MGVINIEAELAARNPKTAKEQIAQRMQRMDQQITMLSLAKDAAVVSEADDELIRGLEMIHGELRRECDQLFMLL